MLEKVTEFGRGDKDELHSKKKESVVGNLIFYIVKG